MTVEQRQKIGNDYKARKLELDQANRGNLFALDGRTASGTKTEVICKRHLQEFIKTQQK